MEHLDRLKRSDSCDFEKPRKHIYQKGKIKSNKRSKGGGGGETSGNKFVKKGRVSDKSNALEKSIIAIIVGEPGLGLLNPSEMDTER